MDKSIYQQFFYHNNTRPEMQGVIYDGEKYAYATDAKRALRWEEIDAKNAKLDVGYIYKGDFSEKVIFRKSDYLKWKENLPLVQKKTNCDVCEDDTLIFQLKEILIDQKTGKLLIQLMNRNKLKKVNLNFKKESKYLIKVDFSDCSMIFANPFPNCF